ncbi:MAG: DUF3568 family protein [Candidatus Omnitrophica bacterium]|nr:DUF3568 family protein [Candidatus Omnitrophota bacterium]MCB9746925.1 DUF3568 family protein [Candidatus Omnitrophota bacterium]
MNNELRKIAIAVLIGIVPIVTTGCIPLVLGAAAGAGGVVFIKGNLEKNLDSSVKQVHKASLAAMEKLDLFIVDDDLDVHDAKIKAEDFDGKSILITVKALTERSSKLTVRVGVLGDEERSAHIISEIESKL